jgi:RNA polymerase sigma-70 factor (ECF subfamily)
LSPSATAEYEELRPLLFSIAYRMTGSVAEAEDIVQDAFLRAHGQDDVDSPRAYLSTVVTRLSIDHLRSARARRETYVGPWLPEPLVVETEPGPAELTERAEELSLASLALLERLSPVERAALVLHDVLDFPYAEIAAILERSEDSCRQLVSRARRRVEAGEPRHAVDPDRHEELTQRFVEACFSGDVEGLTRMLADDAVAYSDGGGRVQAARKPVTGADRVARFLVAITSPGRYWATSLDRALVNGVPGRIARDDDGRAVGVVALDAGPAGIERVYTPRPAS